MALTDLKIRTAKAGAKLVKLSDGQGLQLWVTPDGAKRWRLAYRADGKQKLLAIGVFPGVGLAEAREAAREAKKILSGGKDPMVERKRARATARISAANTFESVASELIKKREREGRAPATLDAMRWLARVAHPHFGARPISEITAPEVLAALQAVEKRETYSVAVKLREFVGQTFRFAIATARAEVDPTYSLRGALTTPPTKNRAAIIDAATFGELLRAIDDYKGAPETRAALQLLAATAVRPGELRAAAWCEFDLDAGVWTIPEEKTKMRRSHRVPLAPQVITMLRELRSLFGQGDGFLFPNMRERNRYMSENTLVAALRRLGFGKEQASAYGFRSTFSSMANESGLWSADAIERQLAHVEKNAVRRAYARADYWDERVRMMSWWSARCDEMRRGGADRSAMECRFPLRFDPGFPLRTDPG
jgi:integrase